MKYMDSGLELYFRESGIPLVQLLFGTSWSNILHEAARAPRVGLPADQHTRTQE